MGLPILGLLGILEAGRGIPAPLAIGGEWALQFDSKAQCADGAASARPPVLNISQSGTQAVITWNDSHATTLDATIKGSALISKSLTASISGKPGDRTLAGTMSLDGCGPVAFKALRQNVKKRGA